jgi:MipA family protein
LPTIYLVYLCGTNLSTTFKNLLLLLLVFAPICRAKCDALEPCLETHQWQFGVALGLGLASNPLKDGDKIPLLILPDVAWYGDKAYFDNGELGYQWTEQKQHSFVTFIEFDREAAYFSFWHPANILSPINKSSNLTEVSGSVIDSPEKLSIDDIGSRHWAVLGGGRWYYQDENNEWQFALARDISNTHNGNKLTLSYQRAWHWQSFRLSTELTLLWKSAALLNYYYGVRQSDGVDPVFFYQAKAGWQPAISISLQKKLDGNWQWLSKASFQRLNKGMTESPLVEENNLYSFFSGFAYHF